MKKLLLVLLLIFFNKNVFAHKHFVKNWTTKPIHVTMGFLGCDNEGGDLVPALKRDKDGKIVSPGKEVPGAERDFGKLGCGVNSLRIEGDFSNSPFAQGYGAKIWDATFIVTESEERNEKGQSALKVEIR